MKCKVMQHVIKMGFGFHSNELDNLGIPILTRAQLDIFHTNNNNLFHFVATCL